MAARFPPPPARRSAATGKPTRQHGAFSAGRSAATGKRVTTVPELVARRGIVPFPLVPASPAQRAKVARLSCLVCGRTPVDPAHLVPQKHGGCAHPDCVVALCRTHHRLYDKGLLALAPYVGRKLRRERVHALTHVRPAELRRALRGEGWIFYRQPRTER